MGNGSELSVNMMATDHLKTEAKPFPQTSCITQRTCNEICVSQREYVESNCRNACSVLLIVPVLVTGPMCLLLPVSGQ
jgi:hypothetical protein